MRWKHPHLGEDLCLRTVESHGTVWRKRQEAGATSWGDTSSSLSSSRQMHGGFYHPVFRNHIEGQGGKVAEYEWTIRCPPRTPRHHVSLAQQKFTVANDNSCRRQLPTPEMHRVYPEWQALSCSESGCPHLPSNLLRNTSSFCPLNE